MSAPKIAESNPGDHPIEGDLESEKLDGVGALITLKLNQRVRIGGYRSEPGEDRGPSKDVTGSPQRQPAAQRIPRILEDTAAV